MPEEDAKKAEEVEGVIEEPQDKSEVAPQQEEKSKEDEGFLREVRELREKLQEAEEEREMLKEKLDSLNTQTDTPPDETDEDDIITVKQAKAMVQSEIKNLLVAIKVQRAEAALKSSDYAEDFEKYLPKVITGKKVLIDRILEAENPVEAALEIMKRNPEYKKKLNTKDSKKIAENLNKPKNLSQVSGTSVGKKSPKEMTPEEVMAEQNKILS